MSFEEKIIRFKRDTSFRNDLFTPESFAHPAKLDAQLLIWIVEKYTHPSETILDPMFGSGTLELACTLGRNVIGIELEQKFVDMAKANWEKVRQKPQLGYSMGNCQILQGDARNLSGLLADNIITSPPYADMSMGGGLNTKPPREGSNDQSGRSPSTPSQTGAGKYDKIITSPPYGELANEKKNTKSNVSHEECLKRAGHDPKEFMGGIARNTAIEDGLRYSHDNNNIGNLPYGSMASLNSPQVDSVITSPPYEEQMGDKHHSPRADKLAQEKSYPTTYTDKVDHIVTSPPYEEGGGHGGQPTKAALEHRQSSMGQGTENLYGIGSANIGNLKSDSYLSAMLQVYQQCYTVLKSGGLMILITKNFIREQKEIRLDLDTIKLCEQAGFTFQERWYRELPAQSFWRILYNRKFPDAPKLKYEDVLVFGKKE